MSEPNPTPPPPAAEPLPELLRDTANGLRAGTQLGEFELRGVLGEGGFATVYRAYDSSLRRTVAVKEYMPGALATRAPDGSVIARDAASETALRRGMDSFLNEARLLAQFDHPALIRVHRVWEQNQTAYMAMQLCQGRTLRALQEQEPERVASEAWLKQILAPILDALELLHGRQCYHRDLSPDNIMILDSGVPMVLDFGAARQAMGENTQALTVIVKPGFAPIEQYDSVLEQGPWTDIYSLGAVLHFCLTGKPVTASVSRLLKDPLPKLAETPGLDLSPAFAAAIDRALTVHPDQRIRSVAEFRQALQLPAFWADMQRQSVELGALRSHAGNSVHGTLDESTPTSVTGDESTLVLPKRARITAAPTASPAAAPREPATPPGDFRRHHPAPNGAPTAAAGAAHRPGSRRWPLIAGGVVLAAALVGAWLASQPAEPPPAAQPTTQNAPAAGAAPTAAPAAPAPDSVGAHLQLDVMPWGVVYVDGQMHGLTPPLKQIWLQPGRHTIEVRNSGLPTHTETVTIEAGKDVPLRHHFE